MRLPALPVPRLHRPSFRLPGRPRPDDSSPALLDGPIIATTAGTGLEPEDVRILRRTRLRLMALSGVVTAVILVIVGVGAYAVVARAIGDSEQHALDNYLDRHRVDIPSSDSPEQAELTGEGTNLFEIRVSPTGRYISPPGLPSGLPNVTSLQAALQNDSGMDQRSMTLADGTDLMIVSVQAIGPGGTPGWELQIIQNRTGDLRLLNTLLWSLVAIGGAAMLAAVLAGYLYAGRALVPIRASMTRREAALTRQREFAANASHELRTPLTVIGTSVEDLKRNRRSRVEDVGEALEDIDAEVRHMTALVEDLLLLARTDSGVVQVEKVPVDLADVAVESASVLGPVAEARAVRLELDPLPAVVLGDPLRLRQLVTILSDNAVKHTREGSKVLVRVRADGTDAVLEVEDQGPGVREEDLPRIFERFWRADDAPAGGTGLGLAIAKWIVEQHGGTITVTNRPEGGASFVARLPLAEPRAAAGAQDADGPEAADDL